MKKFYFFLFISCLFVAGAKAQSVMSTTIICFRDANNNGNKDVGENAIAEKIDLFFTDSASNSYYIYYCGAPIIHTVSTSQTNYHLLLNYEFNQFSLFWSNFKPPVSDPFKRMNSGAINFGTTVYVPIPPGFGDQYAPVSSNLRDPVNSSTVPCLPDSLHFQIALGIDPLDPTCAAINNYSFDCQSGVVYDFYINNVAIDSYTYAFCNPFIQTGNMTKVKFMGYNDLYVAMSSNSFTFGLNTIKYIVRNATGFPVNSVATFTFNSLVNINCGQLFGHSFVDCNNNCVKDGAEVYGNLNSTFNFIMANNTNTYTIGTNANGYFNTLLPYGTYSIILNTPCPISNSVITIPTSSTIALAQPANTVNSNYASLMFWPTNVWPGPGNAVTPGGTLQLHCAALISNTYCIANPIVPTRLKLILPPEMYYINVLQNTPAPITVISAATGDSIAWNASPINYFISVGVKTTAVIGTPYTPKTIITPLNDSYPQDNFSSQTQVYGAPFDPNNKTASHPNMLSNGNITVPVNTNEMIYTVNFQNLGNASAVNVAIRDTFDTDLDLSTLKVLNSSFPAVSQVNNTSREVLFTFPNIMLPPGSVNDYTNRGFVTYQVNMNPGLPIGTTLKNRAHIYFDYNSPVSTNQTINTLVDATGIKKQFKNADLFIYPNPTSGDLSIRSTIEIKWFDVHDMLGKKVLTGNVNSNSIPTNKLNKGIYILDLYDKDDQKMAMKFIKSSD
jgi:hypothetical protein